MGIGGRKVPSESTSTTSSVGNETVVQQADKNQHPFVPQTPKFTFDQVILNDKTLTEVYDTLAIKDKSDLVFDEWGLSTTHKHSKKVGINLYGPPGTGKTMVAHAVADYLNRELIVVNYADIESKYVGDTPKNLTAVFKAAKETNSIIFFDEADAMLSKRVTNMSSATDTSVNQTRSVLLTLLNDFDDVILFATNYIENFDEAFMRRILAHIKFELPDYECRVRLYETLIPKQMPTSDLDIHDLAASFDSVSGSDISNAILRAAFKAARTDEDYVKHAFFAEALHNIVLSKQANQGTTTTKPVSEEYAYAQLND